MSAGPWGEGAVRGQVRVLRRRGPRDGDGDLVSVPRPLLHLAVVDELQVLRYRRHGLAAS